MFVSDTHLPHLLPLHAYFDREWYAAELEHVPRPAWWPVAVAHELPRDGDFITFDHVDGPDLEEHHTGAVHKTASVRFGRSPRVTLSAGLVVPASRRRHGGLGGGPNDQRVLQALPGTTNTSLHPIPEPLMGSGRHVDGLAERHPDRSTLMPLRSAERRMALAILAAHPLELPTQLAAAIGGTTP